MEEYHFTEHAQQMLLERRIQQIWVWLTIAEPETVETKEDGTIHYLRPIEENGGRYLRVVINPQVYPKRIVTVFFDRRLRRRI